MIRAALAALAFFWAGSTSAARAQEQGFIHVVRAGETAASIAQAYYGDPRREEVLVAENGLDDGGSVLLEGSQLVIPTVRYHHVERGDTWRSLAERYYGDPARASLLVRANNGKANVAPDEGSDLLIPYPLRHRVRSGESLHSIASHYYGSRDEARQLRAFNGGRAKASRGQTVLVPLFELKLSAAGSQRVQASHGAGPNDEQARRMQGEVQRELPRLRALVHAGSYVEAVALGNQLLGVAQRTGNQELSIQRELATAYVALGREDLAIGAFTRALEKQPDLELDSVRTSPRVLSALEAAKEKRAK